MVLGECESHEALYICEIKPIIRKISTETVFKKSKLHLTYYNF